MLQNIIEENVEHTAGIICTELGNQLPRGLVKTDEEFSQLIYSIAASSFMLQHDDTSGPSFAIKQDGLCAALSARRAIEVGCIPGIMPPHVDWYLRNHGEVSVEEFKNVTLVDPLELVLNDLYLQYHPKNKPEVQAPLALNQTGTMQRLTDAQKRGGDTLAKVYHQEREALEEIGIELTGYRSDARGVHLTMTVLNGFLSQQFHQCRFGDKNQRYWLAICDVLGTWIEKEKRTYYKKFSVN